MYTDQVGVITLCFLSVTQSSVEEAGEHPGTRPILRKDPFPLWAFFHRQRRFHASSKDTMHYRYLPVLLLLQTASLFAEDEFYKSILFEDNYGLEISFEKSASEGVAINEDAPKICKISIILGYILGYKFLEVSRGYLRGIKFPNWSL